MIVLNAQMSQEEERRGRCGRLGRMPWSFWEIVAMVAGFVIFWPLGLLALFLKWKNGEMWHGSSEAKAPWNGMKKPDFEVWKPANRGSEQPSGNASFDAYRREALEKLEAERRKLDEEQKAFGEFVDKLRRAKDQDEFDRFMAERRGSGEAPAT